MRFAKIRRSNVSGCSFALTPHTESWAMASADRSYVSGMPPMNGLLAGRRMTRVRDRSEEPRAGLIQ